MITRSGSFTEIANRLSSKPVLEATHFGDTSATIAPTGTSQCFSVCLFVLRVYEDEDEDKETRTVGKTMQK